MFTNKTAINFALVAFTFLNASDWATGQIIGPGSKTVKLVPFHSFQADFPAESSATNLIQLPDNRFLVATQGGTVRLLSEQGEFIDKLLTPAETGLTELDPVRYGMTTIAVHPDFANSGAFGYGKLYVHVTQAPVQDSGVTADFTIPGPASLNFQFQDAIRELDVSELLTQGTTSFIGRAVPSRDVLRIDQPQSSHNVFDMVFNSRGDLHVSVGDAGFTELLSQFAGLHDRRQASQDLDKAYGKILRINPDPTAYETKGGRNSQYSIPDTGSLANPAFTDPSFSTALPEIFANGVRSPFRLNLDPNDPNEETLWLGDVGEGSREEVSQVTKGSNLGWGRFEGTRTSSSSITVQGNTPQQPKFEYNHSRSFRFSDGLISSYSEFAGGRSISGGHIYQGTLLGPEFQGLYIGAELGNHNRTNDTLSRLFYGDPDANSTQLHKLNLDSEGQRFANFLIEADDFVEDFDFQAAGLTPGEWELPQIVLGVYEDNNGELYVLGADFNGLSTISRIVVDTGDFDQDGDADGGDFLAWQRGFGTNSGATLSDGDADHLGSVDGVDLGIWQEQFGARFTSPLTIVPEPNSRSLSCFFAVMLVLARYVNRCCPQPA